MTGVCHTHQCHRELHLTDFQLQRAEPRGEHILEVTSPQSFMAVVGGQLQRCLALRWKRRGACSRMGSGGHRSDPKQPPLSPPRSLTAAARASSLTKPSHGETSVGMPSVPTQAGWPSANRLLPPVQTGAGADGQRTSSRGG